jgi:hypothetical protein
MLVFTSVYFFESGLFNGLRPFGIKKLLPSLIHLSGCTSSLSLLVKHSVLRPSKRRAWRDQKCTIARIPFSRKSIVALIALVVVQAVFRCGSNVLAGLDPAIHAFNASKWRERFARTKSLVPPSLCFTRRSALGKGAAWMAGSSPARTARAQRSDRATSINSYRYKRYVVLFEIP